IAEEGGIKMPSFLGYVRHAVTILFPLLILVTLVFFRS
ncbi:MAG: sodium:proton antiporter, partial [Acidobacteria bacterium]|nr:sodium:proton antiporter [Acidobacteriota bacterium]